VREVARPERTAIMALETLEKLAEFKEIPAEPLEQALASHRYEAVRLQAARTLVNLGHEARVLPYMDLLVDYEPVSRSVIMSLGEAAVPELRKYLTSKNGARACLDIQDITGGDADAFWTTLNAESEDVRWRLAQEVGTYSPAPAFAADLLGRRLAVEPSERVWHAILWTLLDLGKPGEIAIAEHLATRTSLDPVEQLATILLRHRAKISPTSHEMEQIKKWASIKEQYGLGEYARCTLLDLNVPFE